MIDIDFEALSELATDYIFAGAGHVAVFVEDRLFDLEQFVTKFNEYHE